jgi:tRNA(Ile)-lysidine synthase
MRGRIAVATSGGRDSTALLHATARAARDSTVEVHALHVHHGLMPQADAWVAHLQRQCSRWRRAGLPVQLHVSRLQAGPPAGDSVEAWARRERYRALAAMARDLGIRAVLLAHHRRDQAETLLLQALRGAGAAGLASMPASAERDGIHWLRPWLEQPRAAIEAYLRRHRLTFVDDASNRDPRFARSRLRQSIWPALEAAFPDAEAALAAAARRAHEVACCAVELAAADGTVCIDARGCLQVGDWLTLSPARRANLLRCWLAQTLDSGVPESLVQRLLHELPVGCSARKALSWPSTAGPLRLYRGVLQWAPGSPSPAEPTPLRIDLSRPGRHELPRWGGRFTVTRTAGRGIPAHLLAQAELRPRQGGEQFQREARSVPRSLKKQFQAGGVAPWQRGGPLVYAGAQLLFVPGLGADARACTVGSDDRCHLLWQPTLAA